MTASRDHPDSVVIHVGTHKTGTTAIQASLANARSTLLDRGVLYPEAGRGRHPGHVHLAWQARNDSRQDPVAGGTEEVVNETREFSPRTVLLSSEEFLVESMRTSSWAAQLAERLGDLVMHVIGYVRPQWEYMESIYVQSVKGGAVTETFDDFVVRNLDHRRFDYPRLFSPWADVCDVLTVRPYRKDQLLGHDIVEDFWHTVDALPWPPLARGQRLNERPGAKATEMLRAIGQKVAEKKPPFPGQVLADARRIIADELTDDVPFRALTWDHVLLIYEHFLARNELFIERFMPEMSADVFELPETLESPIRWSLQMASPSEIDVFKHVLRHTLSLMESD